VLATKTYTAQPPDMNHCKYLLKKITKEITCLNVLAQIITVTWNLSELNTYMQKVP